MFDHVQPWQWWASGTGALVLIALVVAVLTEGYRHRKATAFAEKILQPLHYDDLKVAFQSLTQTDRRRALKRVQSSLGSSKRWMPLDLVVILHKVDILGWGDYFPAAYRVKLQEAAGKNQKEPAGSTEAVP